LRTTVMLWANACSSYLPWMNLDASGPRPGKVIFAGFFRCQK
jgi:hypothetical protein